jgi:glycosyltransferase involved in cell wall biosynthesis
LTRLLYFTRDYNTHDYRFLTALARTEHQVFYLQLERREPALETRRLPASIEPISWEGGRRSYRPEDLSHLQAGLERVLAQVQPDLVQAGPLHLSAYLAARAGFEPLLSMSWGYDLLYEAPRSPEVQQAVRYTLSHSAAMLGDCTTIRRLAVGYGMPDERIVTFPWGIDLAHFSPPVDAGLPGEGAPFTLLSTRGWEAIYGIEVLARGFSRAARQCPVLRLVMLGSGSQAASLREIFEQAGVLERVKFAGAIGYADLPDYHRQADLYLSASRSDGTSISLLEALACGTPALVSDIPGNREWITPGVEGWWFPDGDAEALAEAILQAVAQRSRLPEMGMNARRLAEQRADWTQNFPKLFQAFSIALDAVKDPSQAA